MQAKLRYNPEHTAFEVTVGDLTWAEEISADDESVMLHHENGCYLVTMDDAQLEGLEPNSVYELRKVTTVLSPEEEFEFDKLDAN
jgi:hypothetical protein